MAEDQFQVLRAKLLAGTLTPEEETVLREEADARIAADIVAAVQAES